jgi:hypothetical protein
MPDNTSAVAFADFALHLGSLTTTAKVIEALQAAGPAVLGFGELSLLLRRDRQLLSAGATDESLATATTGQLELGEGPALDAVRESMVACADLSTSELWPCWAAYSSGLGWRSWLSLRLTSRGERCLGVLNVGSRSIEAIEVPRALILAAHLAVALDTVQVQENLLLARDAQMHVGQAVGLLMERYQLTADQAFSVLRRYSQDQQVKLRDVAAQLLETRRLPGAGRG